MRRNSLNWEGDESMAAIRAGQGLLVGLLRCGHCRLLVDPLQLIVLHIEGCNVSLNSNVH